MQANWMNLLPLFLGATHASEPEPVAKSGWGWIGAVIVVSVVIALAAAGWLVRWFLMRRKLASRNDPRGLLHELCRAHKLSRRAEGLLVRAASAVGTPHPARLFLEPRLLWKASQHASLAGSKRSLHLLYEELFGEIDEE